jgi:glycosyltransferase involved in cell wall biosynthesis
MIFSKAPHPKIVVLIPCLNEERAIYKVVQDFKRELPQAEVIVFDNASIDHTVEEAQRAGATVITEQRRGKGFVVQSMFQKVDADIYIIVDGDDTYPAERVHQLLQPVISGEADMAVGSRITDQHQSQFRWLNLLGNKFYLFAINLIFNTKLTDVLSGYRCMNRRFVKGIPLFVTGFEVEVELTIKSLERGYQIVEIPVDLRPRPEGSHSKIRIMRDGIKILWAILSLFRDYKPLTFFGILGLICILLSLIPGINAIYEYLAFQYIFKVPSTILAIGLVLAGMGSIAIGLILHTINHRIQELEYYFRILVGNSKK